MLGLLTWPVYGSWFPHPGRGWIDRHRQPDLRSLPEPTRRAGTRGELLKWPPARLDDRQRGLIIEDLGRIAALRSFEPRMIVVTPDHVHVLLSCDDDRDVPRLVQLIKGALSRMLTVAAGDEPATSTAGQTLLHHKWWTRQYSFVRIPDAEALDRVKAQLDAHEKTVASIWRKP